MPRTTSATKFTQPLNMNGLCGRMVRMPAPAGKQTELLLLYGQHSALEQWRGLLRYLNRFGAVTAPDMPGFGGMDSFYKIGKQPTIDNYADYLAAFVKMRYKRKKVAVIGVSFGFVVATRMLQRYPELAKRITLLVSLVGFAHADDFSFSKRRYWLYRTAGKTFSYYLPAACCRYVFLNGPVLRTLYGRVYRAKAPEDYTHFVQSEVGLWRRNDLRTRAHTFHEMLALDNCTRSIRMQVWHVAARDDQRLDHHRVEQHLRVTFSEVHVLESGLMNSVPDEAAALALLPAKLRHVLARAS